MSVPNQLESLVDGQGVFVLSDSLLNVGAWGTANTGTKPPSVENPELGGVSSLTSMR